MAQTIKNLPAMPETDDPLERAWQSIPVFLPGESSWTEEPGGLQSMGSQRVGHNWATKQQQWVMNYHKFQSRKQAVLSSFPPRSNLAAASWAHARKADDECCSHMIWGDVKSKQTAWQMEAPPPCEGDRFGPSFCSFLRCGYRRWAHALRKMVELAVSLGPFPWISPSPSTSQARKT